MIRIPVCLYLLTLISIVTAEDAIIISHDGETIMVNDYSTADGVISFTSVEGDKDKVPRDEVFALLIRAKRSTEYTPKETQKHIAEIKRVFKEFPGLRKQIQPVMDEWLRIRSQSEDMSKEKKAQLQRDINTQFDEYNNASMKDEEAYLKLRSNLEMVRYRDVRGLFEEQITTKLNVLGNRLIEKKAAEIAEAVDNGKINMASYKKIKNLVRRLMTYYPAQGIKKEIKGLEAEAAAVCLKNELKATWGIFKGDRSGKTYLKANANLKTLETEFTNLPDTAKRTAALRTKMRDSLAMKYDFNTKSLPGFPLSRTDKKILKQTHKYCSSTSEPIADPVAILFPTKPVDRLDTRKNDVVILRAILKHGPSEGLRLYFKPFGSVMRIKSPIKDNGVEIRFSTRLITHMRDLSDKKVKVRKIEVYLAEGDSNKPLSNPISFAIR